MLSLHFSPFPQRETERLLLKQINEGDAPDLFSIRSDKEVMKYLDRPPAQNMNEVVALIKLITDAVNKNEGITWGIYPKTESNVLRGTIGFWRIQKENYRAEIGYLLHPSLQGKGLMYEAMKVVLNYGFNEMRLHSIEANVNPSNVASINLLERNGFVKEAYFKENCFYDGRFLDSAIYSLLTPSAQSFI
ncbi:GNAT family N-acetyltransferase [Flavisolibacter ginsenosidimutans]|uniref:GNAT family N-acetyltransferase n=1 Tax=Flavisolibacter ginsenosidimutans TaxID=661481 RepID=A0A5B8UGK2_9BACT|nr:GNAT family N-acetyltransferase [Flavisolibacter ginsenosidimutans]QEC55446.1 GNAT family N-acetyltransferase [Flavisolibacter ginsenosidimutans]